MKTLTEKTTGIAYGNGCSSKHSEKINHQINRIPDTVLLEGRFESGKMLRYEMETVKQSHKYTRAIEKLRNKSLQEERKLRNDYQQFIVRHISFIDDDEFKSAHPDLAIKKKTDSPDEDKSVGDASALVPVLNDFFSLHPDFHPDTFLGDSAFDSGDLYGTLIHDFHFSKALIPYNPRNESILKKVGYNAYGYPICPNDSALAMKYCGITKEKGRTDRIKWTCPKMHYHKGWVCECENPCSTAARGRTTYTYKNMDLRMFPGIQRDSEEWNNTYKTRAIVERAINHFKINMCIAGRKTRNHASTKADVFLAGIASQLTVIVAYAMNCPQYIRSLKPLVA